MKISVEQAGIDGAVRDLRALAQSAEDLKPLAWQARQRWHEAERRRFATRSGLPQRAPSTLARYRYPVRRWRKGGRGPMRRARTLTAVPGVFTGQMRTALTRPQQPGIRDSVHVSRGQLATTFGVKGKGPVAHAVLFDQGAGSAPPREIVVFDRIARRQLAGDVEEHLMTGWHGRRR